MKNKTNKVYIYGLVDPRTNKVRYIGKANDYEKRLRNHLADAKSRNQKVYLWIRQLIKIKLIPGVTILEVTDSKSWQKREISWIARYREKWELLNTHKGGTGFVATPETLKKRSITSRNLWRTDGFRNKWLKAQHAAFTPEYRTIIGNKSKQTWDLMDLDTRNRHKELSREAAKKMWADPTYRKKTLEAQRLGRLRAKMNR